MTSAQGWRLAPLTLAVVLLGLLSACGGGTDDSTTAGQAGSASQAEDQTAVASLPQAAGLSATEMAGLAYMREEEQLAHDVYTASSRRWALPIFSNIARSEAVHTESVRGLLDTYVLPDPLAGLPEGRFTNPDLQRLYDALAARSTLGQIEALTVGAEIEELDMQDIVARMNELQHPDILRVYENLLKGSRNHLRAFVGQLAAQGVDYTPRILSRSDFDAIVGTPKETGH